MLPAQEAAMSALGAPRYSVLVRIETTDQVIRAWAGVGELEVPTDTVEDAPATYLGVGLLGEVPALRQLIGGVAERLEFALSVPSGDVFALADDDVEQVRRAPVSVGLIFFGTDWQQSDVAWLWSGTADSTTVSRQANGLNVTRQIKISAGSAFTDRTRANLSAFTDTDQRSRSSDDSFCSRVDRYTQTATVKWPA
jgi:hypothetical protein